MGKMTYFSWENKKRTLLRNINPGDIFCFALRNKKFGYGRIIAKVSMGHTAEIFTLVTSSPSSEFDVAKLDEAIPPVVIDSYSLFDKKLEGDWRIIANDENFDPSHMHKDMYFAYGAGSSRKKVDVFGNKFDATELEAEGFPRYSPKGDKQVQDMMEAAEQ